MSVIFASRALKPNRPPRRDHAAVARRSGSDPPRLP
jgi:hypothetical protein